MKKQVTIHLIIGLNKLQYLNYQTFQYNLWCEVLSNKFYVPVRELQPNTLLWNWFCSKWESTVVTPFLEENEVYISAGIEEPESYWQLFHSKISALVGCQPVYPGPIIKAIKKQHYKNLQNQ